MVWGTARTYCEKFFFQLQHAKNIVNRCVLLKWLSHKPSFRCSLAIFFANNFVANPFVRPPRARSKFLFFWHAQRVRARYTQATSNKQQATTNNNHEDDEEDDDDCNKYNYKYKYKYACKNQN